VEVVPPESQVTMLKDPNLGRFTAAAALVRLSAASPKAKSK